MTGGSAWKWSDKRNKFYLHQFTENQPDLNLRDENLKTEIKVYINRMDIWKYLIILFQI